MTPDEQIDKLLMEKFENVKAQRELARRAKELEVRSLELQELIVECQNELRNKPMAITEQDIRLEQIAQGLPPINPAALHELYDQTIESVDKLVSRRHPHEETIGEILAVNARLVQHAILQDERINQLVEFCRLLQGIENGDYRER